MAVLWLPFHSFKVVQQYPAMYYVHSKEIELNLVLATLDLEMDLTLFLLVTLSGQHSTAWEIYKCV